MSDCQFCESCFNEGVDIERERIIKLLEAEIATCEENNLDEHGCRQFDWETYWDVRITEFKVAIALIEGEQRPPARFRDIAQAE